MKKKIISFIVALALAVPVVSGVIPTLSEGAAENIEDGELIYPVKVDEINFPDENFRNYIKKLISELDEEVTEETTEEEPEETAESVIITGPAEEPIIVSVTVSNEIIVPETTTEATTEEAEEVDRDYWLTLKIASQITEIDVSSMEIQSLVGIEYFFALETLKCSDNEILELGLSNNKELVTLDCSNNGISELDLSNNNKLVTLDCCNNNIVGLNLSKNTELETLCCSDNPITPELDLSKNTSLRNLECSDTNIIALYLGDRNDVPFETFEAVNNGITIKLCSPEFDITELPDYGEDKSFTGKDFKEDADFNDSGTLLINIESGKTYTYDYDTKFRYEGSEPNAFDDGIVTFRVTFLITSDEGHKLEKVENDFVCSNVDGLWIWQCSKCGKYFTDETEETEAIVRDAHSSDEYECNFCQHWQVCSNCGQEFDREYHDVDKTTNTCIICGKNFDHYHNLEFVEEKAPTCTEEGMKAHYYCAGCRMYFVEDAFGHIDEIQRTDLILEKTDHQYELKYDDDQHWKECRLCGDKQEVELHEFDDGDVIKEAACEDGLIRYTCICGYQYDEIIPAKSEHRFTQCEYLNEEQHILICELCGERGLTEDHDYDIEVILPSCFESGKMIYTCKDCGYGYEEESGEPTGNHNFSAEYKYNSDYHWHECQTEGCTAIDSREEHIWDDGEIIIPPTVDDPGVIVYTCIKCEAERSDWVDKLDPPETDPDISEPSESDPSESDPSESDPSESNPSESDPSESDPSESDPSESDPSESDPSESDPSESDPSESDPSESDPAVTDPNGSQSSETDSSSREPEVIIQDTTTATDKTPTAVGPDKDGNNKGENKGTGLIISLIPAAVSGASVIIFKKRNKK